MNGIVSSASGVVLALFFAAVACAGPATTQAVPLPGDPIAQLQPGKAPGTFHLHFPAKIDLAGGGHCAVETTILDASFSKPVTAKIPDGNDAVFDADLRPGSHYLAITPVNGKSADYWPSERQQIHIDVQGRLYQMRDGWNKPGPFVLDRRMKGLSPDDLQVADNPRPTLKWAAVPGATHYRGDYWSQHRDHFDVETNQFVIGAGVPADSGCMWRISAFDADGKMLARGEGRFLGNGTDKKRMEREEQAEIPATQALASSHPYLGFQPLAEQVPQDPLTPVNRDDLNAHVVQDRAGGFIPGIFVATVMPDSPALAAGLIPDDVIIAIDGKRVPAQENMGDVREFVEQIHAMGVGRKITLTVRRFPRELTLHATIGQFGGDGKKPAPASAPATLPQTPAARLHQARWTWSDVDAGTPFVTPFTAKPGADLEISQKTWPALASLSSMAELPNGVMAFGSREGLSIWDGSEIRTYTGPSISPVSETLPGNSGLPATDIQKLMCDSHGRLWIGTAYGVCRIDNLKAAKWRVLSNRTKSPFAYQGMDEDLDVTEIFEASDGRIVMGGRDSALVVIDPKTDVPTLINHDDDSNHWTVGIAEDDKHRLWIAVQGVGLMRYENGKFEKIEGKWNTPNVNRIAIDKKQTVWFSTIEGLTALYADGSSESFGADALPGQYINSLTIDRAGRLWVVCYEGLAVRVEDAARPGKSLWKYVALTDDHLSEQLLNTSDGSWWTASPVHRTAKLDLSDIRPTVQAIERMKKLIEKQYPKVNLERRKAVASNGIVVAYAGNKLLRYDGRKWEDLSDLLAKCWVYDLFADRKNGTIWVATAGAGLIGLDPSGKVRRFNNDPKLGLSVIYSVDQTPDGTLYAGTQHGVYRLIGDKWEHLESDLFQVIQVLPDRNGRVWMIEVTYDKLYVYDGKTFREIKEQTPFADEKIASQFRLDEAGDVLIDMAPRSASKSPPRTYKWKASEKGPVGPPVEVVK